MEQCNSITLRSGKQLEGPRKIKEVGKELELPLEKKKGQKYVKDVRKPRFKLFLDDPPPYVPIIPYPQRLKKGKLEQQFAKFLDKSRNFT